MNVLIIRDDETEGEVLRRLFKAHFPKKFHLIFVNDIDGAREHFRHSGLMGMTVISLGLKCDSLDDLFSEICRLSCDAPVLFYGREGLVEQRLPQQLYDSNEANGVMVTPFRPDEFFETVSTVLAWHRRQNEEQNTIEVSRRDYLPMRIKNFYRFESLPTDGFIELSDTKFVRIISANERYGIAFVQRYVQKGVQTIWLKKEEHIQYLTELLESSGSELKALNDVADSLPLLIKTAVRIHETLRCLGVTDLVQAVTEDYIQTIRKLSEQITSARDLVESFPFVLKDVGERTVLTSFLVKLLADRLKWESQTSQRQLIFAALVADSALEDDRMIHILSPEDDEIKEFTKEDIVSYFSHPSEASEVAKLFTGYPDAHIVVAQHHELPKGDGFPGGLNSMQIHGLSSAFILANNFVNSLVCEFGQNATIEHLLHALHSRYYEGSFRKSVEAFFDLFGHRPKTQ